ncbi:hypothetical protein ACVIGB_006109 [Bradyrhizobium sp. USDA 4341]
MSGRAPRCYLAMTSDPSPADKQPLMLGAGLPVHGMSLTMDPRFAPKKRLDKRERVEATLDAIAAPMQSDLARVKVMAHFRKLVADGFAEWRTLDDGTIRLRLATGETYLLEQTTITRIA